MTRIEIRISEIFLSMKINIKDIKPRKILNKGKYLFFLYILFSSFVRLLPTMPKMADRERMINVLIRVISIMFLMAVCL